MSDETNHVLLFFYLPKMELQPCRSGVQAQRHLVVCTCECRDVVTSYDVLIFLLLFIVALM